MTEETAQHVRPAEHSVVYGFLDGLQETSAVCAAFSCGLVDRLYAQPLTVESLASELSADLEGFKLLVRQLVANNVVEAQGQSLALTQPFRHALKYRDLMQPMAEYLRVVYRDLVDFPADLFLSPKQYKRQSHVFRLFTYDVRRDTTPQAKEAAANWMAVTTATTRYQAQSLCDYFDFGDCKTLLDVGGNSGELALQLTKRHPALDATVLDLPVVCEVGKRHLQCHAESSRITFVPGDFRAATQSSPRRYDAVLFKSFLHDWQEPDVAKFLHNAAKVVEPTGCILIFERFPISTERGAPLNPFDVACLPFWRWYRSSDLYTRVLHGLGFADVRVETMRIDSDFMLVVARK